MDYMDKLFNPLMVASILGLVRWIWSIQSKLHATQLDLAKNYHGKEELKDILNEALKPVTKELERLAKALEKE